jgi:hypothetical protein
MTKSQEKRYARILMRNYPVLVAEFLSLGAETWPPRLSQAQWERRQEKARARLRVKYASELAQARYAVEHGTRATDLAA